MASKQQVDDKVRRQMMQPSSLDQFLAMMVKGAQKERTADAKVRLDREQSEPTAFEVWQLMIAQSMPPETQMVWRKAAFLESYVECGTRSGACRTVHITLSTVRAWEIRDPSFKAAMELAEENIIDDLEEEAIRRGKEKSDNLLIFLLKNKRPQQFTEKTETKHIFAIEGARQKLKAQLGEMAHRKQLAADNSIGQQVASDLDALVEIVE
jgi:hypothetical protein